MWSFWVYYGFGVGFIGRRAWDFEFYDLGFNLRRFDGNTSAKYISGEARLWRKYVMVKWSSLQNTVPKRKTR